MLLLLAGCSGIITIETVDDIAEACDNTEPVEQLLSVSFEAANSGCAWGQDGNLQPGDGRWSARGEQTASLDLPEDAIICGLEFDFQGLEGGEAQDMAYDDNFFFLFNGVVLATSYGPAIERFELDGDLPLWAWDVMVGTELEFSGIPSWCLGEEAGDSDCTIPAPETEGTLSLDFGGDLVDQLAFNALEQATYDFTMVGTGDNDDTDCSYSAFEFELQVPVIMQ
jgi:hypothetical protein